MSMTKQESNALQKKPLRYYQELLDEYAKEYKLLVYQLYTDDDTHSAINGLLQLIQHMNGMLAILDSYDDSTLKTYLITKNWVVLARIKNSLLLLNSCLIIRLSNESDTPTFDSIQSKVGWCMDGVIFHKESVYYASYFTNSLQVITIPEEKEARFHLLFTQDITQSITLAQQEQLTFIHTLPGLQLSDKPGNMDYIALIKQVEANLHIIRFKDDQVFQVEMFYALTEAASKLEKNKLENNPKEYALLNRYPVIMDSFIKKCSDNIVKLTYYYRLLVTAIEKEPHLIDAGDMKTFFDVYGKIAFEYNRLQQDNRLDSTQKVDYINANFYAHHIKINTHPSLKGFSIKAALQQFTGQKAGYEAITKYMNIIIALRDDFFVKNVDLLLGTEVVCGASIASFITSTRSVCAKLIDQLSYMMEWSIILQYGYQFEYKNTLYKEALNHKQIISQYYACYNLLNNHLTQGQHALRVRTPLDIAYENCLNLFSQFSTDSSFNSMIGIIAYANRETQVSMHQKALLASEEKKIRKAKPVRTKQIVSTDKKPIKEPKVSDKIPEHSKVNPEILRMMEEGCNYITTKNYRGAGTSFWKAYNLATYFGDNSQKLVALDCLCDVARHELEAQLNVLEGLAKGSDKTTFEQAIQSLLQQIPQLKKLYDQYNTLAKKQTNTLSLSEKQGVDYSREQFWQQLVTVQNKLPLLMEQQAKKNQETLKKQAKNKPKGVKQPSQPLEQNKTVQRVLEKHFDDLATETQCIKPIIAVGNKSCMQTYTLVLPDNIQRIFTFLNQFKGTHYLVGSMVLQLLLKAYNQPAIAAHDADFISTCNDRASLIIAGFQENTYMRNLYSLYNHFEWPIDLISLAEEDNWLMHSLNARDFRVAALCCDKDGQIIDPTGFGLEDLLARRLVMIGEPSIRFKQDPVLLLRTLKYMLFGFKPDALIHDALSAWQPDEHVNTAKLYAVTRKHLLNPNERESFIDLLAQYGLLGKLFNLKHEERAQLLPLLGVRTVTPNPYGLFKPSSQSGQEVVGLTNRL